MRTVIFILWSLALFVGSIAIGFVAFAISFVGLLYAATIYSSLALLLDTLQEATSVTVVYNAVTTAITSDASQFQLQDENVESVMELTEAILLAKARDWAGAQQALQRAVKSLKLEGLALRDLVPTVQPTTDVIE